ncbi:vomeronasal type-2 receptor 26-like [Leptodactylus fuscus]|uniref:vomeronasal type-2 receptor 26-like n=1 Tax=Leptodactylus fuscus TaxID=238119 RepID=UPI003F4F0DF0
MQLIFGVSDPILPNRDLYPTTYYFTPNDQARYEIIIKILKDHGWNWVGIITTGEESNQMAVKKLSKMMAKYDICIEYIINLEIRMNSEQNEEVFVKSTAQVVVICGLYSELYQSFIQKLVKLENITLILHESWVNFLSKITYHMASFINGSIVVRVPRRSVSKVVESIFNVNPSTHPNDPLLEEIWFKLFRCLSNDTKKNGFYQWYYRKQGVNCTEMYYIPPSEYEMTDTSLYYTYVSVYILAHALNTVKEMGNKSGLLQHQWRLRTQYMKYIHFREPNGYPVFFNERGEVPFVWIIGNWVISRTNMTDISEFLERIMATIYLPIPNRRIYTRILENYMWKNDREPYSRCKDPCNPGYRKAPNGGVKVCCYDCVPCSEDEMSNVTDSDKCHKCLKEEWPDEKREKCVPKTYEFLSYEKDILVPVFLALTLFFSAVTLFVLRSFVYYWDTPIVKANNRTVSFILLVSILLGFLCVFFFLGRPVAITCLLRQTSFGIFFSIGVSSVLAKTITVCIAFKATKPGSVWMKLVSQKVSNSVVLVCSSVQVLICVIWLLVSPPYVEFDHQSYPGKIIIQCNEGSDLWFYSMLGYMGLLAAVSFLLAFMVRTLPDSFNEAKYITFSMLLFCSVWMAMIPAYLSTRGKYMVAVEIFAILTSCAGILGCIFFPKVYILLLKPNFNSRNVIMVKNKLQI